MGCNCDKCGGTVNGLHHIGIRVSDAQKSEQFYSDILGFKKTAEYTNDAGTRLVFIRIGTCVIELIQSPNKKEYPTGIIDHVALEVADIEPLVCRLTEKQVMFDTGIISENPHMLGGTKNIFFKGPDGERIELFEAVEGV